MRTLLALALLCGNALAQSDELEKLRKDLEESKKRIDALEKEREREKLEKEIGKELEEPKDGDRKEKERPGDVASYDFGGGTLRLVDLSVDVLATGGWSTARNDELGILEAGDHDPHVRGFTVQNVEFTALGAVDPYFNGAVHLVYAIDSEGESKFELEEAFFTTTSLPAGLQLKGGQNFLEFGRHNSQHPHAWQFCDTTVAHTRFFGADGLRSQGLRASWLVPVPVFLEVIGGVYNARGETMFSFLQDEEEAVPAVPVDRDIRNWRDMAYLGRLAASVDIGDTIATQFGTSWIHGPNTTGLRADTDIFGADFYLRWKPVTNEAGWPFLQIQGEVLMRRYERAAGDDGAGTEFDHEIFQDWGAYAQIVWGFTHRWTVGLRYDWAEGEIDAEDPRFDARQRLSPALTFYPTEFSKIRLQYNYEHASHIALGDGHDEHSFWLQVEFLLGKHGAHKF